MVAKTNKALIIPHAFIATLCLLHLYYCFVLPWYAGYGFVGVSLYSLCPLLLDIFLITFSIVIVYYLYYSNKRMYHKIAVVNILFLSMFFLIQCVLLPHVVSFLVDWIRFGSIYFHSSSVHSIDLGVIVIFSFLFVIPALPSIFTIWYANKDKSEVHRILLLSLGIIFITIGTPIFIDSVVEIPATQARITTASICGIDQQGVDKFHDHLVSTVLMSIVSFISMSIGGILMARGSVGLLKSKINNNCKKTNV